MVLVPHSRNENIECALSNERLRQLRDAEELVRRDSIRERFAESGSILQERK